MLSLSRTDSKNSEFIILVTQLDADLNARDGDEHAFYNQFNSTVDLNHVLVLYANETPVGCGALKKIDELTMEVKRMFVLKTERSKGYATMLLEALELWAKELKNTRCILETGKRQPEAIALYKKGGYLIIPNYVPYQGIENSVCFQKKLSS